MANFEAALFSFIGAVPRTAWLPDDIETDAKGFVRTGPAVETLSDGVTRRQPFLLETSRRGGRDICLFSGPW